jgi:hypothetical protein
VSSGFLLTASKKDLLLEIEKVFDAFAVFGDEDSELPAARYLVNAGFGDLLSAPSPHTLACRSILESENVREHIGHSALILTHLRLFTGNQMLLS